MPTSPGGEAFRSFHVGICFVDLGVQRCDLVRELVFGLLEGGGGFSLESVVITVFFCEDVVNLVAELVVELLKIRFDAVIVNLRLGVLLLIDVHRIRVLLSYGVSHR